MYALSWLVTLATWLSGGLTISLVRPAVKSTSLVTAFRWLITAGLARDCQRFSGGRYASVEQPMAKTLPFPGYCVPR